MGINGILKIVSNMSRSKKGMDKQVIELCQKLAENSGRVSSTRLPFQGEDIQLLPKVFREMTAGVKNPRVTLGYNAGKGQATMGLQVAEGSKPIGGIAISMDTTRGAKPILQTRYKMVTPETGETALSGSMMCNPNSTSDDFIHAFSKRNGVHRLEHLEDGVYFSQTFNPIPASKYNLEMPTSQEFTETSENIGEQLKRLKGEYEKMLTPQKGNKPKAAKTNAKPKVTPARTQQPSFAAEVKKIMAFEGATSVESANKAKVLLMKRMGYDPNLITIKGRDLTNQSGYAYFNALTGEIVVDAAMAGKATHFDVADVLVHELQHMDDHVKLCKKIGIDEYEKLITRLAKASGEKVTFNRAFYEKAIQQADITGFDAKPLINEIKGRCKLLEQNLSDEYLIFSERFEYATSPMEIKARQAEKRLIRDLQAGSVKIRSSMPLEHYGETPSGHLIEIMPKIEGKLSKYPLSKRNDIFNNAHDKALAELEPEFAQLLKKLKKDGLVVGTPENTRFKELNKNLGGKEFEIKLLNRIMELI